MLARGKAAVEAGLCCPTAYITELTLLIAFLSQLCAAARVCPTRTTDLRGGKPSHRGPTCSSHTVKTETTPEPGQHPTLHLHTPTFAVGAPRQVLPQAAGGCLKHNTPPGQLSADHCSMRPWARKSPEKKWDCTSCMIGSAAAGAPRSSALTQVAQFVAQNKLAFQLSPWSKDHYPHSDWSTTL